MLNHLTKEWYLCYYKHCSDISQWIFKYLFVSNHLSFEREFDNQFKNLIIAIKLSRRQIKDIRYSEAAIESQIGVLNFLLTSLKNTCEKIHFCQWPQASSFTKKGILSAFLKDFAYRFSWQNYWTAILKKTFSIKTLLVAASVYANNFLKKKK